MISVSSWARELRALVSQLLIFTLLGQTAGFANTRAPRPRADARSTLGLPAHAVVPSDSAVAANPPESSGGGFVLEAGLPDGFELPPDPALPSPALVAARNGPLQDFDLIANVNGGSANTPVGHTFYLPGEIESGTLELRIRAGDDPSTHTDGLWLSFTDETTIDLVDAIAYKRSFGPQEGGGRIFDEPDPGLLQDSLWSLGDDKEFSLDLSALPLADGGTVDILPLINARGFVDVVAGDETGEWSLVASAGETLLFFLP